MKYRHLSDCHIHSDFSPDADDSVVMLCEQAEKLGIYLITITDHCECNLYLEDGYDKSVQQSFFETRKAASAFPDRLQIRSGVELGQPLQNLSAAQEILKVCEFDFVLGSVHNIKGMEDFYFLDYNKIDAAPLLDRYFDEVLEMAEWNGFDSLAHLTYPLRYIVGEYGIKIPWSRYRTKVDLILKTLVKNEKALELNTSGLRQKIGETMPNLEVIRRFRELGGKYVTLGSDAHRFRDVALGIETGMDLLLQAGFSHFTVFTKRTPKLITIE